MTLDNLTSASRAPFDGDSRYPMLESKLDRLYQAEPSSALLSEVDRWAAELEASSVDVPTPILSRPRRRHVLVLSAIAASLSILVVAATVASATGLVDWGGYFLRGFGTERIAEEDLGTDLNLTQMVDGFTVTIGRVYADPYSVAMAVRITPPDGLPAGNVDLRQATLYDAAGRFLGGPGAQGGGDNDTRIWTFYNTPMPAGSTTAQYRYEVTDLRYAVRPPVVDGEERPIQEVIPGIPCQREPPYRGQPPDEATDATRCYLIASVPLVFEFEVPLGPGVSAMPGPRMASNGTVATITRISAGRIGASIDIEGVGPFASVSIETGGETFPLATYGYACPYDVTTRFNYTTDRQIPMDTGPWTIRVSATADQIPANAGDYPPDAGTCNRFTPEGEWAFPVDPTTAAIGSAQETEGRM